VFLKVETKSNNNEKSCFRQSIKYKAIENIRLITNFSLLDERLRFAKFLEEGTSIKESINNSAIFRDFYCILKWLTLEQK